MTGSYRDHGLGEFLDLVAERQPAPGGGAVAAVTVSLAAGLVAMAARYSADRLEDGERLLDRAEGLRARTAALVDADADAYRAVIAAYAAARDGSGEDHRRRIRDALTVASDVQVEVAAIGAETAQFAGRLALEGKRDIRGDAVTALLLAEAATRSAAHLVAVNVGAGGGDAGLVKRAGASVASAGESMQELPMPSG